MGERRRGGGLWGFCEKIRINIAGQGKRGIIFMNKAVNEVDPGRLCLVFN